MKVLHFAKWYPSSERPSEGIWIRNHIQALRDQGVECKVYHFDVKSEPGARFLEFSRSSPVNRLVINLPFKFSIVVELIAFVFLAVITIYEKGFSKYDLVNFHVAYPSLVFWRFIRRLVLAPVVVTEHWSAYHDNFGIADPAKRKRIQGIFQNGLPLITVSDALYGDILRFSNADNEAFKHKKIPNIVSDTFLDSDVKKEKERLFFAFSSWQSPKRPEVILRSFARFREKYPDHKLVLAGSGKLDERIRATISELDLEDDVIRLGSLTQKESKEWLERSQGFIHCSDYETFSVVCAESIGAGVPVIASAVGGIKEIISESNGILVAGNDTESFFEALEEFVQRSDSFSPVEIQKLTRNSFSESIVGQQYVSFLKEIVESEH